MDWIKEELGNVNLGDKRLNKRLLKTVEILAKNPLGTINASIKKKSEKKGAYRLFSNDGFDPDAVISGHLEGTKKRMEKEEVVLSIQDTSFMSFVGKKITGLGNIGGNKKRVDLDDTEKEDGYIFHGSIGLSVEGEPLGLQSFLAFSRGGEALWEKESQRWQDSYLESKSLYSKKIKMVTVADREADQYEFLKIISENEDYFVVRSNHDREIYGQGYKLSQEIESQTTISSSYYCRYQKKNIGLAIRYGKTCIASPVNTKKKQSCASFLDIYFVEICIPSEDKKWILLTNLKVTSEKEALTVMHYYRMRWQIEEFFKILKGGACQVEKVNLRSFESLVNYLSVMTLISWNIHHAKWKTKTDENTKARDYFSLPQMEAIQFFKDNNLVKKQPENVFEFSLEKALKLVAQMGGYNNRKNDGPPGPITLYRGFIFLHAQTDAVISLKRQIGIPQNVAFSTLTYLNNNLS